MSDKIVVPVLGESITEATVAKWLKNKGDSVEADEPVVELETDKVNLEVPSPSDGVLSEINAQNGSTVEVGAVLGSIIGGSSQKEVSEDEPKKDEPIKNEDNVVSLKKEAESKEVETNQLNFLKIDILQRNSHALSLMLRNEDVIVGLNGKTFRGTQKILNQKLKDEDTKIITIFRKEIFF